MRETGLFGKGGNVAYQKDVPKIDPFDDDVRRTSFYQTHYKAKDWEYEEEYRLTKLYFDKPNEEPKRIITVPDDCFKEVTIGMKASEIDKIEIIKLCRVKYIPVYQAYNNSFEFVVKRKLIEKDV